MGAGTEVELKFRLPRKAWAALLNHPALLRAARGRSRTQRLYSVYYDTPELDLAKSGIALRLRRDGRRWIQTVKAEGQVSGALHRRREWEAPVSDGALDLTKFDATELEGLLDAPGAREHLKPVFVTDFLRWRLPLALADGTRAELALDQGEIRANGRVQPLTELELELEAGQARALFALALELARTLPLEVEVFSKAERGLRLAQGLGPPVVKACAARLDSETSVEEAFCRVVAGCVVQLQGNVEGMHRGQDPEHLHQMRVALRRARSALGAFSRAIPKPLTAPVGEELEWLTGELGPARDWDVFLAETLPSVLEAFPGHQGLRTLQETARGLRDEAHARARDATLGFRYRGLILGLGAWLEARSWRKGLGEARRRDVQAPVAPFARAQLARRHRRFLKRGRRHERFSAPELHRLRIAGKKLRYACEFFAGLFSARAARAYIEALRRLQDVLGVLNDAAVTEALLLQVAARASDAQVTEGVDLVRDWSLQQAARRRRALSEAWERFVGCEPFWE
jgi:triphosphatase